MNPSTLETQIRMRNPLLKTLLFQAPHPMLLAQRCLILIPDQAINENLVASHLFQLFEVQETKHLIFLTLVSEPRLAPRAQRRLVTLAALVRRPQQTQDAEIHVQVAENWAEAARRYWEPGDLVICPAEQVHFTWFSAKPLAEYLVTHYKIPVYLLVGLYPKLKTRPPQFTGSSTIFIALTILLFLGLQFELTNLTPSWLSKVLLVLSIVVEYLIIAWWNIYT